MSSGNKINIVYLGIFLCVVCAIATGIMASVAAMTQEPIKKAKSQKTADGLKLVLPDFNNDPIETVKKFDSGNGIEVEFFRAEKDGKLVGFAAKTSSNSGYSGKVEGIVSFDPEGKIRTFIISDHKETPGLGSNVTDRKKVKTVGDVVSGKKDDGSLPANRILDQFSGHSAGDAWKTPWAVKKDGGEADFISGATISSRAVTEIAWRAAEAFSKHKAELLGAK